MTATDHPLLRPYRVFMEARWEEGERFTVRIPAALGPHDARNQARELRPGASPLTEELDPDFHEACGFRFDLHDNRIPGRRLPFGCPTETTARLRWGR